MDIETGGSAGDTLAAIVITNELSQTQEDAQMEKVCANCGTSLTGPYCHSCGQSAHIHRSLLHMVEELLHGLFHFDTKAWRTIPALIFRPGHLTRDYIAGKRTSYVSPLALFLFLIFLMFFVFSSTMNNPGDEFLTVSRSRTELVADLAAAKATQLQLQDQMAKNASPQTLNRGLAERIHDNTQQMRKLQDKLNDLDGIVANKAELETEVKSHTATLDDIKREQESDQASGIAEKNETLNQRKRFALSDLHYAERQLRRLVDKEKAAQTKQTIKETLKGSPSATQADQGGAPSGSEAASAIDSGDNHFKASDLPEYPLLAKLIESADKNRQLTLYKMKKNAASLAFLLIPISLPFLWLLFAFRRQFVMFDHAVFSLYSLSFMSVFLSVLALLTKIDFTGTAGLLLMFIPPIHMFTQLRHAYQLSVFEAIWRTIALLFIALASLIAYAAMVTLFSA